MLSVLIEMLEGKRARDYIAKNSSSMKIPNSKVSSQLILLIDKMQYTMLYENVSADA
jgi:hypothetical protein